VLRAGVTKPAETLRSTIRVRCINCGQTDYVITVEQTPPAPKQYACPVCRHAWTEADERAPFRKMYRGER
jgi:DNA-directed RNA polymerase subunit M/transcription elongation factor TFIIS